MGKDNQRGMAVVKILKSDSILSVGKEFIELGVDSVFKSGALEDIPLVNTVVGIYDPAISVRDHLFATKFLRFMS